jgi:malate synthase
MDIPAYQKFLPTPLLERLWEDAEEVAAVPGLRVASGLRTEFPELETDEALALVVEVYQATRDALHKVLEQRLRDRQWIDSIHSLCAIRNEGKSYQDPDYATAIGAKDPNGRVIVGPLDQAVPCHPVDVPAFLKGEQVTLFGPPDSARMSINAMNALHRRRPEEAPLVERLVAASGQVPRWGADDEDSKTPIMASFLRANRNLAGCFDKSLFENVKGKDYSLATSGLSLPIKRVPGLALPDGSHLLEKNPLPLHLFDLVMHLWHHRHRAEAQVLYFPKLENEEEAAYLRQLIVTTEEAIARRDARCGTDRVRILVVFENPRAIFRIREIAAALHPYFLGGSLGWHDFLASTARLFRMDPNYRIPVKADPNIVIRNIRESHRILVEQLGPMGAMKIGGMYGILFEEGNAESFRVSMVGFIRDLVTQLKRGLDGFWIAHPDFVRIGIALVQAWRQREQRPDDPDLHALIAALVPNPPELERLIQFVEGPDIEGLAKEDPLYLRGVLAATTQVSPVIANHDPEEIRYNIFQALQYLADWLCGNGCVALPAKLKNARGEPVSVRIMDDLATTERSRWELWAEIFHGRVSVEQFERILAEEVAFLQGNVETPAHRIQVRWEGEAARWYPVAVELLRKLVLDPNPPEFVTELALVYTFPQVREGVPQV